MYPPQASSWSDVCVANQLAFRAVCNSAIDPSRRPLKKRVIERLSDSPEAKDLYRTHWVSASHLQGSQPENFFKLLGSDILWQTKVAEEVESERSWKDLSNGKFFGKFRDWTSALFEKLAGKEHPAARALTAATLGLSLVVAIKSVGPVDTLTIPVSVVATYDKKAAPITLKLAGDSVKVNLEPVTDSIAKTQVPIQLQLIPDKTAVPINFVSGGESGGRPKDALTEVTKKLESSNVVLRQAAASLDLMAKQPVHSDLTKLYANLDSVSQNVFQTRSKLDDVNRTLAELKTSYETQSREQVLTSKNEGQNIDQKLKILARASANQRDAFDMSFQENTCRTVLLPHFDPDSGQETSIVAGIDVRGIREDGKSRTVNIDRRTEGSCDPAVVAGPSHDYSEGKRIPLNPEPWNLTVISIERNWYGRRSATLRFTPESSAIPNNPTTIPLQSSVIPPSELRRPDSDTK